MGKKMKVKEMVIPQMYGVVGLLPGASMYIG